VAGNASRRLRNRLKRRRTFGGHRASGGMHGVLGGRDGGGIKSYNDHTHVSGSNVFCDSVY
jgi:hypothetical protein